MNKSFFRFKLWFVIIKSSPLGCTMPIVSPYFQKMNVAFKWVGGFLLCIWEGFGSISNPETDYPDLSVCGFLHHSRPLFASCGLTEYC